MNESDRRAVEGFVDGYDNGVIRGWVWQPNRAHEPVSVELVAAGEVIACADAVAYRGDLAAADIRGGHCAFVLDPGDRFGELTVRAAPNGHALPGSPVHVPPPPVRVAHPAFLPGFGVDGQLDRVDESGFVGWAKLTADPMRFPELLLVEGEQILATIRAELWRDDLQELRQGDGRWGFSAPLPSVLRDGRLHRLELRLTEDGPNVLRSPLLAGFLPTQNGGSPQGRSLSAPNRPAPPRLSRRRPELSVVVVFHNMAREAERTLLSLSRAYQREVGDIAYEVIAVDNGSEPALDGAWVASFGPEFRLFRPRAAHPSPVFAMNEAARTAHGRFVAVMIDGAHLATPGLLAEAARAFRANPRAVVVTRHWFVGGDQRWLAAAGYTRAHEDLLFARIGWPRDGYELFRIGAPIGESPNSWFDGLSESNCLFMPASLWRALGGYEEYFDEPGGGFANLDLFRRAADARPGEIICLLGEATFHQYHGGSTTNVPDEEKECRVRQYEARYRAIRGHDFAPLAAAGFRLAGCMRSHLASSVRQRPLHPGGVGVTDRLRPGSRIRHFDPGAERHLQATYAELGLHETTRWRGLATGVAPTDMIAIAEIIGEVRPWQIVTNTTDSGLLRFLDDCCRLESLGATGIVLAGEHGSRDAPARTRSVPGDPFADATLARVDAALEPGEEVLVLFEPPAAGGAPIAELAAYARFVTFGSYLVYLGSALGQPWIGYSTRWPAKAIRALTTGHGGRYAIDNRHDRHLVTVCPSGFIRRVGGRQEVAAIDPTLDLVDAL